MQIRQGRTKTELRATKEESKQEGNKKVQEEI